jgi:predicted nucleic-acid-binding protein
MTGLDNNILVRIFIEDDKEQGRKVKEFLQALTPESPGYVSLIALIELAWVLRSRYLLNKAQLIQCLERLLKYPELVIEGHTAVTFALRRFSQLNADFADCLIELLGHAAAGCGETVTFDLDASRFAGMRLL